MPAHAAASLRLNVHLDRLRTKHWRNIEDGSYEFASGVNVLVGGNGQGKTNFLEAIQYLALGRSHRAARDEEIVRFGEEHFHVAGNGGSDSGGRFEVEASFIKPRQKRLKVDGESIVRLTDLTGVLACVAFGPEDTGLASGSPEQRRRFVDYALAQTSRSSLRTLSEYRRIQQQRGSLLRGDAPHKDNEASLAVWDGELVSLGCQVIRLRARALVDMAPRVRELYTRLTDGIELRLKYDIQALGEVFDVEEELGEFLAMQENEDPRDGVVQRTFRQRLEQMRAAERMRKRNLVGPHRDDVALDVDGRDIRRFGSQGQCRAAAVSLKIAQAEFVMARRHDRPIVVLDDVFAELDEKRAEALWEIVCKTHQTFLAVPRRADLVFGEGDRVFSVEGGRVRLNNG